MSTVFSGQGTIPTPTKGANVRVSIATIANSTPIQIVTSAAHGFYTGDTIEQENTGVSAANGQFQITVINGTTYNLNGTVASGAGTGGYAIDYELQPAYQIPANGDLADVGQLAPAIEGLANTDPFLYRRTGKLRLYNQYFGLLHSSPPWYGTPWDTESGTYTQGQFVLCGNSVVTFASICDTPTIPPYFGPNDYLDVTLNFSATYTNSSSDPLTVGLGVSIGTGLTSSAFGGVQVIGNVNTTAYPLPFPVCSRCLFTPGSFTPGALEVGIGAKFDSAAAVNSVLQLFGEYTITAYQYRLN